MEMAWMNCLMGKSVDEYDQTPPMSRQTTIDRAARFPVAIAGQGKPAETVLEHDFSEIIEAWEKACNEGGDHPTLDSRYYFDIYKLRFYPLYSDGFRYLEEIMENAEPSLGYHTLSLLLTETKGNNLVITTNFDTLVEDSLYLYTNKKPLVINHDLLAQYVDHNKRTRPIIAKLHHGLFFDPMNTNEVNDEWIKAWSDVLVEVFRNYIPVVIGYGGGDTSLMRILNSDAIHMREGILWCTRDECGYESKNPEVCALVQKHKGFFIKIKGFDDLMLHIGNAMFSEKISTEATAAHLESQTAKRVSAYKEQYTKLTENDISITIDKALSADECVQKGNNLRASGKYVDAIRYYKEAIRRGASNSSVYFSLGYANNEIREFAKAIENYSKCIELNPSDVAAYYNRGIAWKNSKEYSKAIGDYSKAIELDPSYAAAYFTRGIVWYDSKEYRKAIDDYSKAIELNPSYTVAYYNRGLAWKESKEYGKAIEDYDKAIELNSSYIAAYRNRAAAYDALNQPDLAEADRKKAAELEGKTT